MRHILENGKTVTIPDKELEKLQKALDLSLEESIDLWLEDHEYQENEEQNELDEKAKKCKIDHNISKQGNKKPKTVHVSDEKKTLFKEISNFLDDFCENYGAEMAILKENKLFSLKIGEKTFKIDIIEQRPPKKAEDI